MKRLFSVLCLTALLAGVLTGCGMKEDTGASSTQYVGGGTTIAHTGNRGRVADDAYAEDGRGAAADRTGTDPEGALGYYGYTAVDDEPFRQDRDENRAGDRTGTDGADDGGRRMTLLTRTPETA